MSESAIGPPSIASNAWNAVSVSAAMIVLKCRANPASNMAAGADSPTR